MAVRQSAWSEGARVKGGCDGGSDLRARPLTHTYSRTYRTGFT